MLYVYWVTLKDLPKSSMWGLGVGVTARSESDACELVTRIVDDGSSMAVVQPVEDMNSIEQNHVRPNMGNPLIRGIWFPLGYSHIS